MKRSCVLLLTILALQARSDPIVHVKDSPTTNEVSAPLYPEAVVLVPEAEGQKPVVLMVPKLGGLLPELNDTDPAYNEVQNVINDQRAGAVVLVAALESTGATNITANVPSSNNSSEVQSDPKNSTVEEEFIRKRRSPGELAPLNRKKRTYYDQQPNPCMICGMMPQTKQIVINIPIFKKPKKKKQPSYYPPPCGYPQCGGPPQYHPPPPPPPNPCGYNQCGQPQYHPPPPPPPPPQHYPQTCNVCQQGGGGYPPPSGSYSHSSSQSSSSSYSSGWGKK